MKAHGGGTIAVSSQSSAASAILEGSTNVAGIGGFSGRESDVSARWLAQEVRAGKIRWVLGEQSAAGGFGGRLPGDTRTGSKAAMAAVEAACTKVTLPARLLARRAPRRAAIAGERGAPRARSMTARAARRARTRLAVLGPRAFRQVEKVRSNGVVLRNSVVCWRTRPRSLNRRSRRNFWGFGRVTRGSAQVFPGLNWEVRNEVSRSFFAVGVARGRMIAVIGACGGAGCPRFGIEKFVAVNC